MGLDMYLLAAHNLHQAESEEFWKTAKDISGMDDYMWDQPAELWYARKFWDLHTEMAHHYDLDNGDYVEMKKEDLEYMLDIATHTPDCWGGFSTVPDLCRVIYNYDKLRENGLHVFYGGDY